MIYLGADHQGFQLKETIKNWLKENNYQFEDLGNFRLDPDDDYPDFAFKVAERVSVNKQAKGILFCGNGVGVSIAANKVAGIRCGLGFDIEQIKRARQEDNINCLAIPADFLEEEKVYNLIEMFINTLFDDGENHTRRIEKISSYETA